ncbi:P-loop containing nucleoside triphosphate hydrolase protein [Peniophora sp. CONT]|nr:P-loop containing nucleoside triphosphate hydrolase protein [Peniophora sp. CONT]
MDYQVVLSSVASAAFTFDYDAPVPLWRDARLAPAYVAAVSAVLGLVFAVAGTIKRAGAKRERAQAAGIRGFVREHGDVVIYLFKVARAVSTFAVLALYVVDLVRERSLLNLLLSITYLYASGLALLTVAVKAPLARIAAPHLILILLASFAVYAYRDLWPLMTYVLSPADRQEGALLWVKLALVTYAGVLIPLTIPRAYVPLDPENPSLEPNPEQTASILSLITFTFLDKHIFMAYRLPHLSFDLLPAIADYDRTAHLVKRSFKHLDAFSGAPKSHMFWALMRVFFWEYITLSFIMVLRAFVMFFAPVGINRLLEYIETGGEGATVRPWVWISMMFFGPAVSTILMQLYTWITTASLVRVEGMITQLIFEHALRIRMKAEIPASTPAPSAAPTPDTASLADETDTVVGEDASHAGDASSTTAVTEGSAKTLKAAETDKDKGGNLVGKINNLVAVDLENIVDGRDLALLFIFTPASIAASVYFLYLVLGWSAFVGVAVMIACLPLPGWVAKLIQDIQETAMKKTDARVQTVTETLDVLRMIKLFGWEQKIADRLAVKRDEELKWIKSRELATLTTDVLNHTIPFLQMVATYSVYTLVMKKQLTASIVFSSIAVFDMLRDNLQMVFYFISPLVQAKVSLDRVTEFLQDTELLDHYAAQLEGKASEDAIVTGAPEDPLSIGMNDASFTWSATSTDGALTPSRRAFTLHIPDKLDFKRGAVNLIVGPTGSGKTSLLMALLGEMHFEPLTPGSWVNLPREGGVAYAAQESWVQNETIRDNILFGASYDAERYKKVIYQCGLKRDLSLFDAGDRTEVGEKGLTLSGGQKARITLARAIYSSAEILLLDDVLAALDVHTSKWIVEKCLKGELVRGRTVILVTHNVALAGPVSDYVVAFHSDGAIAARGSYSEVLSKDKELAQEAKEEAKVLEKAEEVIDDDDADLDAVIAKSDGKLVVEEEIVEGHVSSKALGIFFSALGGNHGTLFWITFLGGVLFSDIFVNLQTWWMGRWADAYGSVGNTLVNPFFYLGVFFLFELGASTAAFSGLWVYTLGVIRAAKKIHAQLMDAILGTTLRFLDTTPTSRIVARATKDIHAVDGPFANEFKYLVQATGTMVVKLVAVVIVTPVFFIPGLLVFVIGRWFGNVYMKAQLSVKREMSNRRAPVLGHFGAAIAGITSIRAYGAQQAFRVESYKRIDDYTRTGRTFYNLNRWISTRIDVLGGLFTAALGTYLVYGPTSSSALPSNVGFSLTMAVGFSSMILWWVRIYNDFEVKGNSLERLQGYMVIEQEPKPVQEKTPPAAWPTSGDLRVEGLSARYSPDGPQVLHELSFHVKSGERVGIVGRTGSGKSSLTLSLLRCIFTEGDVYYDGINTADLNLDVLRTNVTIIPQVPELLSGTLRENLDPFNEHDDAVLNSALRASGLFSLQSETDDGRITLDSQISSGGGNLSVGQRQILALARALVRGSKLLILDEATSSIDYETDTIIQSSLRNELGGDVTLLTVAHRLQTIMDADKIMVLDAGRIVEFDSPKELLKQAGGFFKSLVDESGDKDALYAMLRK